MLDHHDKDWILSRIPWVADFLKPWAYFIAPLIFFITKSFIYKEYGVLSSVSLLHTSIVVCF